MVEVGNAFKISVGIAQRMKQFREDQQVKWKIILILILKTQGFGTDSCGLAVGICEDRNEILFVPYTTRAQLLSDFRLPPPCK